MNCPRVGALLRAARRKRGLRQIDVALAAGVSGSCVSLVERGHSETLSLATLDRICRVVDVRVDFVAYWRGGEADRLLSAAHSRLAESFARFIGGFPEWLVRAEVGFSFEGERGIVDQLAWHARCRHLLIVEFKTEFVDVNGLLATLDRKFRRARQIAREQGWDPLLISVWVIVGDTRTNRRHASNHAAMLRSRLPADGRRLRAFLTEPSAAVHGLAFWTDPNGGGVGQTASRGKARIRPRKASEVRLDPVGQRRRPVDMAQGGSTAGLLA